MSEVLAGQTVSVHYTARSSSGVVVETSAHREPVQFVAGGDGVIAGVSHAVLGMRAGERRCVTVGPEHAFGIRNARLQQVVSRRELPDRIEEGEQLVAIVDDKQLDVWVRVLEKDHAVLDANHPLAGETLEFEIVVLRNEAMN